MDTGKKGDPESGFQTIEHLDKLSKARRRATGATYMGLFNNNSR